jgi:hypothetical protein
MENKRNFTKRERSNDKKIPLVKEPYRGVSWTNDTDENTNNKNKKDLRKNEPFVLMFRNCIFFDVKSYECRKGDLYIRNIVDGIVLKRYFRMDADDQLTVFKNRTEFDEFMKKVKTDGKFSCRAIKSKVTGQYVLEDDNPDYKQGSFY